MVPFLFEQFGSFPLNDVLKHEQAIHGLPILITQHRHCEISPQRFVVLLQVAFLHFIAADLAFERLHGQKPALFNIVMMSNRRETAPGQFLLAIAQHLTESFIHLQ